LYLDLKLARLSLGDLNDQCYALLRWAIAEGRVRALFGAAWSARATHPTLTAFCTSLHLEGPAADAPPAGSPRALYRELAHLLPAQLDELVFLMGFSQAPHGASNAERAMNVVRAAVHEQRLSELSQAIARYVHG
jgi:hypothetical protein